METAPATVTTCETWVQPSMAGCVSLGNALPLWSLFPQIFREGLESGLTPEASIPGSQYVYGSQVSLVPIFMLLPDCPLCQGGEETGQPAAWASSSLPAFFLPQTLALTVPSA